MRRLRKASVIVVLSLILLFGSSGELRLSPIELAAAPYLYDILTWDVSHLPDKWLHKLRSFLPCNSRSHQEKLGDVQEFFRLGKEIRALERELVSLRDSEELHAHSSHEGGLLGSPDMTHRSKEVEDTLKHLDSLRSKRSSMKAGVEETLESEVSAVLVQEGLSSRIGLIFPPVDVSLSSPPMVLVVSPRDRIERVETVLLKPDMKIEDMEALEEKIFQEQGLSALVAGIGGVATYPTIVRDDSSLQHAAVTAAHEWLHTYWFFRPLGWNFWSSPQMTTLNETAAALAGRELGTRVYESITQEKVEETSGSDPTPRPETPTPVRTEGGPSSGDRDEGSFDFNREMRKTRLRVDELLARGKVEEAETYMEERRQLFVNNGFYIRKLNQAYFAFHGTYAASAASVSPIGGEIERLRKMTDSVGDFIRAMAGFGSYQEFRGYLSGLSDSGEVDPIVWTTIGPN